MENPKPLPIFANTVSYHVNATELVLDFGYKADLDGLQSPPIIHSRVVMSADLLEPLLAAFQTLKTARDEQRTR